MNGTPGLFSPPRPACPARGTAAEPSSAREQHSAAGSTAFPGRNLPLKGRIGAFPRSSSRGGAGRGGKAVCSPGINKHRAQKERGRSGAGRDTPRHGLRGRGGGGGAGGRGEVWKEGGEAGGGAGGGESLSSCLEKRTPLPPPRSVPRGCGAETFWRREAAGPGRAGGR